MVESEAQGRLPGMEPVSIVDIGSNSIRLVIYEGLNRAPAMLFNEKVMCGLGMGLAQTGNMEPRNVQRALVAPRPGGGITWAKSALESMVGRYAVEWRRHNDEMEVSLSVPANGAALVRLPGATLDAVTEGGAPLSMADGCANARQEAGAVVVEIGAGAYVFTYS